MAGAVAGITLPPGDPGSIRDTAHGLERVASGFGRAGDTARAAASSVSWKGAAAEAFGQRTGDYEDAGRKADVACMRAAAVLDRFADRLEEARENVKRLQEQAEEAEQRMSSATSGAVEAGRLEGEARDRATSMAFPATLDPTGSSFAEQSQAFQEADAYANERARLEGVAARAREELERLQEQARQEREAVEEAATAAAGQMNGAQDGLPVVYHGGMYGTAGAMEDRVLARVRAGDYTVLTGLSLNTLDEDTQRAVGAEIAKDADEAAYNGGDHSLEEVSAVVTRFNTDEEFAVGFYNQLGGRGTADLAQNITYFHGRGEGIDDPALVALMAPFANLLGIATRSSDLRRGFTSGFMRKDLSVRDRYGGHPVMTAFVMSGTAARYSPRFLSAIGEEVMITPSANPDDGIPMHELSENQDLMRFIALNPEAAGRLLSGTHGPGGHFSNTAPLLMYGPRYSDDGEALGALIEAGTHDLRGTNIALANDASHAVIQATPTFADGLPDGARPALVTILDDHVGDFEYVATERAVPGAMDAPPDGIAGLTYEQGHEYLKVLFADDGTRPETNTIIGERVGENMYHAAARDDTSYAHRAGSLSEMGVLALGDADLDAAESADATNDLAKTASGKLVGLTPVKRVPGFDLIADQAFGELFPTDAARKSLEEQAARQVDELQGLKRLSIATQVEVGRLPPEAMQTINLDGSPNLDFVGGPGSGDDDVVMVDSNGDRQADRPLEWDLDRDGDIEEDEQNVTERQLYDAGLGLAEPATEGATSLADERFQASHPPDIDDLSLPDGYDNNNPSTFEKVWEWPFDADGEGEINNDAGDVVARQDDLRWDPAERVYRLPIEGSSDELTYQRIDGEWKRVVKVGDQWELAG